MVSINHALRSVKEDLANLLEPESIFGICREVGHHWRKSPLNPAVLIHLFVMQILCCNTACTHLRLLSGSSDPGRDQRRCTTPWHDRYAKTTTTPQFLW